MSALLPSSPASRPAPAASATPEAPTGVRGWRGGRSRPRQIHLTRWSGILFALGLLGFISRVANLHRPTDAHTPVFDEKHYVPQAWQILRSWDNPLIGGIEDNPGFGLVVHPPLGKQLEALGMAVFGYTPLGWRIASALCAVAVILLIAAIARRLSRSDFVGLAAGILAICDGILFVTGRSGMLDHFQTFFICLASYFALRDFTQVEARFSRVWAEGRIADNLLGPRVGFRWWRFATGLALGGALAVKWSGLYYLFFAGLAAVAIDYFRRRRFGVDRPLLGTLALDSFPAFASLVLVPVAGYFASWRAWFASETGAFRHAVESGNFPETNGWFWGFLPDTLQNFIYYHVSVLQFHTSLTNSNGHHHDWESKPWSWLLSSRSLLYYNPSSEDGVHHTVLLVGTPAIWWLSVPVLGWALWCLLIHRDRRWMLPVVGFAAGFLPWLFNLDRQMYLFYAVNLAPFVILALALALGQLVAWRPGVSSYRGAVLEDRWWQRGCSPSSDARPVIDLSALGRRMSLTEAVAGAWRNAGPVLVLGYLLFVVWNFLFFLPLYTAMPLSQLEWSMRMWLPSWV